MADNRTRGVIFDMDGVLVDTGEFHRRSWWDLAAREKWEHYTDEFFLSTFGMQNAQIIPRILGRPVGPEVIREMSEWKEARYRELITGKLELLLGVLELLRDLKAHGFKLAIGTSTPRINLEFMLPHMHVREFFDDYVTAEDVARSKPAPDTFLKAAEKLGLPPARCVVVEDAVAGVAAGKAGGMKVIAVTNTRPREELTQADRIIESLAELTARDFQAII